MADQLLIPLILLSRQAWSWNIKSSLCDCQNLKNCILHVVLQASQHQVPIDTNQSNVKYS